MKSSPKSTPTASGPPPRASVITRIATPNPMIVAEKMRTAS
jgi:hypothetical protein